MHGPSVSANHSRICIVGSVLSLVELGHFQVLFPFLTEGVPKTPSASTSTLLYLLILFCDFRVHNHTHHYLYTCRLHKLRPPWDMCFLYNSGFFFADSHIHFHVHYIISFFFTAECTFFLLAHSSVGSIGLIPFLRYHEQNINKRGCAGISVVG